MDFNETSGEKGMMKATQQCYMLFGTDLGSSTLLNRCTATNRPSHKSSKSEDQGILNTTGKVRTHS